MDGLNYNKHINLVHNSHWPAWSKHFQEKLRPKIMATCCFLLDLFHQPYSGCSRAFKAAWFVWGSSVHHDICLRTEFNPHPTSWGSMSCPEWPPLRINCSGSGVHGQEAEGDWCRAMWRRHLTGGDFNGLWQVPVAMSVCIKSACWATQLPQKKLWLQVQVPVLAPLLGPTLPSVLTPLTRGHA